MAPLLRMGSPLSLPTSCLRSSQTQMPLPGEVALGTPLPHTRAAALHPDDGSQTSPMLTRRDSQGRTCRAARMPVSPLLAKCNVCGRLAGWLPSGAQQVLARGSPTCSAPTAVCCAQV